MTHTLPGSLGLPLLGETLPFLKDPFEFELVRTHKHGPVWKTRILGSTVVFFAGPKAFSFFTDPHNFTRDNASPPHMRTLLRPDAVPFIDGQRHRIRKRLLLAAFAPTAMASYVPKLEALITQYATTWAAAGEIRLADELSRLAFDVANVLFAAADSSVQDAARAADFEAMVRGLVAMPLNLPFTSYGKALKARDRLRDYIKGAVADREGSGTALAVLKRARGPAGKALTTAELEIELLHFFFAAHGGLAAALSGAIVALTQHPEVRARVVAEVDDLPSGALTAEDIATMRYTAAVSREVRRAWPIVPSTFLGWPRRTLSSTASLSSGAGSRGCDMADLAGRLDLPRPDVVQP